MPVILEILHFICDTGYRYAEDLIPRREGVAVTVGTPCFVGSTALGATLGLVGVALGLEELLFPSTESEFRPTIGTWE